MAAKRNKSQAKRNGGGKQSLPGWAWLVIGLVLGIGVFLIAPKFLGGGDGFFRPQPNADAQPPAVDANDRDQEPIVENADDDTEHPATTRTRRRHRKNRITRSTTCCRAKKHRSPMPSSPRKRAPNDCAPSKPNATPPRATRRRPRTRMPPTPRTRPSSHRSRSMRTTRLRRLATPRPPHARRTVTTMRAICLQAGAFAASGDAEALKAKIAFLGLTARVESAQIKDNTVYRVRMGPYGTASDLADAKRKLAGGGLPAMAIKVK